MGLANGYREEKSVLFYMNAFQNTDIVVGFTQYMVCQQRKDNGSNLAV